MSGPGAGPTSQRAGEGPPSAVTAPKMFEDVPEHIIWGDLEALGQSSASGSQKSSQYSSSAISRSGPASGDDPDEAHAQDGGGGRVSADCGWGAIARSSRSGKKSKQRSGGGRALDGIQFRGLTDSEAHSSKGSQSSSNSEAAFTTPVAASSSTSGPGHHVPGTTNGANFGPCAANHDKAPQANSAGQVLAPQQGNGAFGWGGAMNNRQAGATPASGDSLPREPPWVPSSGSCAPVPPGSSALLGSDADVLAERPAPGAGGEGLISNGSAGHDDGACKPCAFMHTKVGCLYGVDCEFCHFRHNRKSKPRPCKGKRDRYRRIVAKMEKMLEGEHADSGDNFDEAGEPEDSCTNAQVQEGHPFPMQCRDPPGTSLGKVTGSPPSF